MTTKKKTKKNVSTPIVAKQPARFSHRSPVEIRVRLPGPAFVALIALIELLLWR
jgi:hypothetical protein